MNAAEIVDLSSWSLQLDKDIDEILSPILHIIPAQLFGANLADAKGLNADQPCSLSKVTKPSEKIL